MNGGNLLAAVRIRGSPGTSRNAKDTLQMLNLTRMNHCIVVPKNSDYLGMLRKVQNYVTWGEIDRRTLESLVKARAREPGDRKPDAGKLTKALKALESGKSLKGTGLKRAFRLSPPSRGYKSVRLLYPKGDAGYRGREINTLLRRMI